MDIGSAYLLHHKLLKKEQKQSIELLSRETKEKKETNKTKYIICERCGQSYCWCNCSLILKNRATFIKNNKSYKDLK